MLPNELGAEAKKRERRGTWYAVVGLVVLLGGLYVAGHFMLGNRLPAGTRIAGVGVGGLTPEQAKERLEVDLVPYTKQTLTFYFQDHEYKIKPKDIGLDLHIEDSVESAGGGRTWNPVRMLEKLVGAERLDPVVTLDEDALDKRITAIAKDIDVAPVEPRVTFREAKMQIRRPAPGRKLQRAEFAELIRDQFVQEHTDEPLPVDIDHPGVRAQEFDEALRTRVRTAVAAPVRIAIDDESFTLAVADVKSMLSYVSRDGRMVPLIDMGRFRKLVSQKAAKLYREPKSATVVLRDGKPKVVADKPGRGVKTDGARPAIDAAIASEKPAKRVVKLARTTTHAGFRTDDAKALGIEHRVGAYVTRYRSGGEVDPGRLAGRIDGTVLRPGRTIEFSSAAGRPGRSGANWDGAAQVATTLFNAGLEAGLKVVERHPHRTYQARLPAGRDAALGPSGRDLRLKNTSEYGVLVNAWTDPGGRTGTVHVELWSGSQWKVTVSAGKRHNVRKPLIHVVRRDRCTPRPGQRGFDIDVRQRLIRDDETVRSATISSSYEPVRRIRCRRRR